MMLPMKNEDGNSDLSTQPPAQLVESSESSEKKKGKATPKIVYDEALVHEFRMVPLTTRDESEWYGPWDSLLHRFFPRNEGYQIAPQHQMANVRGGPEWTVYFLVKYHAHIIACIIEIKPYYHYKSHRLRIDAYKRLRDRLEICLEDRVAEDISAIYGLSGIGPRFMVMRLDTQTQEITPRLHEEAATQDIAKVAPKDWWKHKVLTRQGCMQLNRLVEDVKKSLNKELKLLTNSPVSFESLPDYESDMEF